MFSFHLAGKMSAVFSRAGDEGGSGRTCFREFDAVFVRYVYTRHSRASAGARPLLKRPDHDMARDAVLPRQPDVIDNGVYN